MPLIRKHGLRANDGRNSSSLVGSLLVNVKVPGNPSARPEHGRRTAALHRWASSTGRNIQWTGLHGLYSDI